MGPGLRRIAKDCEAFVLFCLEGNEFVARVLVRKRVRGKKVYFQSLQHVHAYECKGGRGAGAGRDV